MKEATWASLCEASLHMWAWKPSEWRQHYSYVIPDVGGLGVQRYPDVDRYSLYLHGPSGDVIDEWHEGDHINMGIHPHAAEVYAHAAVMSRDHDEERSESVAEALIVGLGQ